MKRTLTSLGVIAALVAAPSVARAANVEACVDAAEKSQQLRDDGQLLEAKEKLVTCSAAGCPGAVAKQCARWLQEVEQSLPSIVVRVRDQAGKDVVDATISIDGTVRAAHADGRPIALNPGAHTIVVRRDGAADAEEKLVVVAGEKNRVIPIESKPAAVGPKTPPDQPPVEPPKDGGSGGGFKFPWISGVFFGIGVAGFVGTAILVPMASGEAKDLRATCSPNCAQSDVDAVQTKITAANVLLFVGIGGVAAGLTAMIIANVIGGKSSTEHPVSAFVVPVAGGAAIGATGRF